MSDSFVILIADRNRHVREFLRRELMSEGYRVQVAKDGREVSTHIEGNDPPHLVILDLEIPYAGELPFLRKLEGRGSSVPVVLHSFVSEDGSPLGLPDTAAFVEKSGNTDRLKQTVQEMLRKCYPERFACVGCREAHRPVGTE